MPAASKVTLPVPSRTMVPSSCVAKADPIRISPPPPSPLASTLRSEPLLMSTLSAVIRISPPSPEPEVSDRITAPLSCLHHAIALGCCLRCFIQKAIYLSLEPVACHITNPQRFQCALTSGISDMITTVWKGSKFQIDQGASIDSAAQISPGLDSVRSPGVNIGL